MIFSTEQKLYEITKYKEYSDLLCENHRELSSTLDNEQYMVLLNLIKCYVGSTEPIAKERFLDGFFQKAYNDMRMGMLKRLFSIAAKHGWDVIDEVTGSDIYVNRSNKNCFFGLSDLEFAQVLDKLEANLSKC